MAAYIQLSRASRWGDFKGGLYRFGLVRPDLSLFVLFGTFPILRGSCESFSDFPNVACVSFLESRPFLKHENLLGFGNPSVHVLSEKDLHKNIFIDMLLRPFHTADCHGLRL